MAEYINRKQIQYTWWQKQDGTFTDGVTLESIINAMPTADVVEVVHGEWIADRSPVEVEFRCSECGYSYIEADSYQNCDYNYCPNCGAKMDGDKNG